MKLLLVIPALFVATIANAQINYDYLETAYVHTELGLGANLLGANLGDIDGDGMALGASISVADHYFLFSEIVFNDIDGVDVDGVALGAGYHTSGSQQFVAKASVFHSQAKNIGTEGYIASIGGRGQLANNLEWEANVEYADPAGLDGEIGANAALRYFFNDIFATDVFVAAADDVESYGINFRFRLER